jgi:phosphatidylglycerophosphatase A
MKKLLVSCFGLGYLPGAPGTFGSVPPVVTYMVLGYMDASPLVVMLVMLFFVLTSSVVCVFCSPDIIQATGKLDPRQIVVDEFAGQSVTFFIIALFAPLNICLTAALCFLFFRLFDIIKPWPIRRLEKFPQGWGILADDLLAGVYAAVLTVIILKLYSLYLT